MAKAASFVCVLLVLQGARACRTFKGVVMSAYANKDDPFNVTVDGCVQRQSFGNKTVTKLEINDQDVGVMLKDSVRNMAQLKWIAFRNCNIRELKPGLFRNVPKLGYVEFTFSNLLEVPRGIFNNTVVENIHLEHNRIDTIDEDAFSDVKSLANLFMSNNKLEYWNRNWFKQVDLLSTINFAHNSIRSVPRKAFVNAKNLKSISLNFNEIVHINPDAFEGLYHLDYLGLRYNRLKSVHPEVFPIGFSVGHLYIDANRLNFFHRNLMTRLSVQFLTADGNPWKCACLQRVREWLAQSDGKLIMSDFCVGHDIPMCVVSHIAPKLCDGIVDENVTRSFFEDIMVPGQIINKYCVRTD